MPFHSSTLSPKEIQMVNKLVDACRLLDSVYRRQSDIEGLKLLQSTRDPILRRLLMIMGKSLRPP